jgi:c-di-GMP phosphodiesterase
MEKFNLATSASGGRFSEIFIRGEKDYKKVKISSKLKPEIIENVIEKWQSLLNTSAQIFNIPSGLITRLNEDNLEVFLNSKNDDNPIKKGDIFELGFGHYCEKVIGIQQELVINDARENDLWKDDAGTKIAMISYMGVPINWPDGEVFGTLCMLDSKPNNFANLYINLLQQVKQHIESDLNLLLLNEQLQTRNEEIEQLNTLKSKFLSLISHDVRGGISSIEQLLNIMLSKYESYDSNKIKIAMVAMSQSSTCMLLTLENLLNWSKVNMLELEANETEVDVVEIIKELLIYFNLSISIKELEVTEKYFNDKIIVMADENMLKTSLRNILSNAIKFNKIKGQIYIRVTQSGDIIKIEIEDTGIGIRQSVLQNLFNYNPDSEKGGTLGENSSGIGLFLVKDFLNKNNANITVESKPRVGSKFIISLNIG